MQNNLARWLGFRQPDPASEQLSALKRVVTRLMQGEMNVQTHWMMAFFFGSTFVVTAAQWKAALPHMYFWLDYSGIPGTLLAMY